MRAGCPLAQPAGRVVNGWGFGYVYLMSLSTEAQQKVLGGLLQRKENALCADCNGKSPCWASLDFGVFVCMNCSGAHRFLGPTTTRVRSTKLDTWNKEWVENMRIGNTVLNEYWEHGLQGVNRTAKPTINSSLNDIIKFVQDKYVKRKYTDPNHSLDPLKRSKLPQETKSEILPKQNSQKIPKELPRPQPPTANGTDSPFNAFSAIVANKPKPQRKSSDNLISFEKEPIINIEKPPEAHQPQQPKYNHAQFHTVSGSKPKEDQFIDFDSLVKGNEPAKQPSQAAHSNYLLNPNANHFHSNAGHYSTGHFGNHPQYPHPHQQQYPQHQQYDRAQFVTMNINMNMYPKVMNINMNPQTNHYQQPQPNYLQQPQPQQPNGSFANQFLGQSAPPQKQNEVKITLDSNISLETKKEEPKSWIDEWK